MGGGASASSSASVEAESKRKGKAAAGEGGPASSGLPPGVKTKFKIVLVGGDDVTRVGKTAIVQRYIQNVFKETHPTSKANIGLKFLRTPQGVITLELWDLPSFKSPEHKKLMMDTYMEGMDGAVIVVSTHQNELRSFQMTDTCRDMFVDYQYQSLGLGENDLTLPPGETLYPVVLFGNKSDLKQQFAKASIISDNAIRADLNAGFLVSAKTGLGLDEGFLALLQLMIDRDKSKVEFQQKGGAEAKAAEAPEAKGGAPGAGGASAAAVVSAGR